ncbi:MAG: hypothetical protein E1N59_3220 [Puniceicoccaceae bacterium 5H]|nr:MAG: hypothetical protein E1N59_3220 [Puniceicoccaceae bacterium 5H]
MGRAGDGLHRSLQQAGIPFSENDFRLYDLKGKHAGRRAFIIGNGPSLRIADLDRLQGKLCFAANKIFVAYEQTAWRPSYYFVADELSALNCIRELPHLQEPRFFPFDLLHHIPRYPGATFFNRLQPREPRDDTPFSDNLLAGSWEGQTVTYHMIQFAVWMGATEIYLLGVDFNYPAPPKTNDTQRFGDYEIHVAAGQQSHFSKDYYRPGDIFKGPRLEEQEIAYRHARTYCERHGIRIANATRGGKLEVFERVDFEGLV